ncbi:MAG: hypothetical protein ACRDKI_05860 [Solirubrobacterales bacterium]
MPEKSVLVIGAGASLAEALSHRPKRPRDHPPLDRNFFRLAGRFRPSPLLDRVRDQAEALGEPELSSVSLESHLGRLFFEMNHNPIHSGVDSYFQAIDLFTREIALTTNWMAGRPGLIKKIIRSELIAGRDLSIVSSTSTFWSRMPSI